MVDFRPRRPGVPLERCWRRPSIPGTGMARLRKETRDRWRLAAARAPNSPEQHLQHLVAEADVHPDVPCLAPIAWPPASRCPLDACRQCHPLEAQAETAT